MTNLPSDFLFSQTSLQDYQDCRLRFLLRYVKDTAWPAVQAEPAIENERHILRGERFHRLAQQYLLGLPEDRLSAYAQADEDEHLAQWWHNFAVDLAPDLTGLRFIELNLAASLQASRLAARYDLITTTENKFVIYDWKTSLQHPKHTWLSTRLQTRVYPYLLTRSGAYLNQTKPVNPEQITMVYWFTAFPHQPERFVYNSKIFEEDEHFLSGMISEIRSLPESAFVRTEHIQRCQYCVYRSLCDRGTTAGSILARENDPESNDKSDLIIDLEQISEIEF